MMMSVFSDMDKEFDNAMTNAKVMSFVQVLHRHKDASMVDVAKLAKKHGLMDVSIGQCFLTSLPKNANEWLSLLDGKNPQKTLGPAYRKRNTRTLLGRNEYDADVIDLLCLTGKRITANYIREKVGGSADQARKSLNRHIEAGRVDYIGRARGVKYFAK